MSLRRGKPEGITANTPRKKCQSLSVPIETIRTGAGAANFKALSVI